MKKQFQIYKKGKTARMITICSKIGESFDREEKIKFYLSLGYRVFDLNDKEIIL